MNRYLVFAGDEYYARGGWDDFYASYATLEDAIQVAESLLVNERKKFDIVIDDYWYNSPFEWYQIVDSERQKEVQSKGSAYQSL